METGLDVSKLSYREARKQIGRRLCEVRLHNGLTQKNVAEAISVSQSSYSRMEAGMLAPDCAQIRVLSGLHGVSILWLLGMPNYLVYLDQPLSSSSSSSS